MKRGLFFQICFISVVFISVYTCSFSSHEAGLCEDNPVNIFGEITYENGYRLILDSRSVVKEGKEFRQFEIKRKGFTAFDGFIRQSDSIYYLHSELADKLVFVDMRKRNFRPLNKSDDGKSYPPLLPIDYVYSLSGEKVGYSYKLVNRDAIETIVSVGYCYSFLNIRSGDVQFHL